MRIGKRCVVLAGLLLAPVLLTGCFFNVFQTARMLGRGNLGVALGIATMAGLGESQSSWLLMPQARVALGLSDSVDVGVRTGAMVDLNGQDTSFLGVVADAKMSVLQNPRLLSIALGFGGGYSRDASSTGTLGWEIEGAVYVDYNLQLFPIYAVYRPLLSITGDGITMVHQLAAGLCINLSSNLRILTEVDINSGMVSGGIALEMRF